VIEQVEIHILAQSEDAEKRKRAVGDLKINFAILNDKEQAWDDLVGLTHDNNDFVRSSAVRGLRSCYSQIPEKYKKQAWNDLHRLTQDNDYNVRSGFALALGDCYSQIPEEYKQQAWYDLHELMHDKDNDVRSSAALALGDCYSQIPEEYKQQAWYDLHELMHDKDNDVRRSVALALGDCYSQIPEKYKQQAWYDLHELMHDKNNNVRRSVALALGDCYSQIPEEYKQRAWSHLISLTQDDDKYVQTTANHSSGRISIYRASQAKDDESFRKELETALSFFRNSYNKAIYSNSAKFCLPFYLSFYTITFRKKDAEAEVKQYLAEARSAVEGSKNKEKLLEVVENLGNALKEAQKARDLDAIKSDLNTYQQYCDRACELLDATDEKVPSASRLIRKGLPIIDKKIKQILDEIQGNAKTLCKQTKGTQFEGEGKEINRIGQTFSQTRDPISLEKNTDILLILLSEICLKLPERNRGNACRLLEKAKKEQYFEDKLPLINTILGKISDNIQKSSEIYDIFNNAAISATIAAFVGFLLVEIGTYFYPTAYNHHIISVAVAIFVFFFAFVIIQVLAKNR
jgi:HEAT repeat protein